MSASINPRRPSSVARYSALAPRSISECDPTDRLPTRWKDLLEQSSFQTCPSNPCIPPCRQCDQHLRDSGLPVYYAATSSYRDTSSTSISRRSISSWHVIQKAAHGTAAIRFGEISSSQCRQTP